MRLTTGVFRVGVSKLLVTHALAEMGGTDPERVIQRSMGYIDIGQTSTAEHHQVLSADARVDDYAFDTGRPHPLFLTYPLQAELGVPDALPGTPTEWRIE